MTAAPLTLLIVDDEPPARERLQRLVDDLPDWCVAGSCGTGAEALELVSELKPAVVLLDIRMPGMSGIEAARHLGALKHPPAVVFTTAYDQYALEAFDSQAIGYLLKPVRRERLENALKHAARLAPPQWNSLHFSDEQFARRQHVAARCRDELRLIPVAEILFFRAEQKYVTVRHVNGEELIDESLKNLEDEFAEEFIRIHRSVLISVAHIDAIERAPDGGHLVRMRHMDGSLPVSRRQLSGLKSRFEGKTKRVRN